MSPRWRRRDFKEGFGDVFPHELNVHRPVLEPGIQRAKGEEVRGCAEELRRILAQFECVEVGMSNPIVGRFSSLADTYSISSEHLKNQPINALYCHSEYLGKKIRDVKNFDWEQVDLASVVGGTKYPEPKALHDRNG